MKHLHPGPTTAEQRAAAERCLRTLLHLGNWRRARDVRFEATWAAIDADLLANIAADVCDSRVTEHGLEWRLRQDEGDA